MLFIRWIKKWLLLTKKMKNAKKNYIYQFLPFRWRRVGTRPRGNGNARCRRWWRCHREARRISRRRRICFFFFVFWNVCLLVWLNDISDFFFWWIPGDTQNNKQIRFQMNRKKKEKKEKRREEVKKRPKSQHWKLSWSWQPIRTLETEHAQTCSGRSDSIVGWHSKTRQDPLVTTFKFHKLIWLRIRNSRQIKDFKFETREGCDNRPRLQMCRFRRRQQMSVLNRIKFAKKTKMETEWKNWKTHETSNFENL